MAHDSDKSVHKRSLREWGRLVTQVLREFSRHDMTVAASAISFLALFALFSAISAFVAFYGLFADPGQLIDDLQQMQGFVPADVFVSMIGEMRSVSTHASATLVVAGSFSLVVGLWCAQQGVATLMVALNLVYRERMTDGAWWHLLKSLMIAIGVIGGLFMATLLAIGLPVYARLTTGSAWIAELMRAGGMAIAGTLLFFGLAALYRWVPDRRPPRWRWAGAGAALVVCFWTVASIAFSVFLAYSNSYTAMYGSLSGVVLLLTLTYVTVATVLLGAEFNAQLEYSTVEDTTTAPAQPMGERGAYVADHVDSNHPRADPTENQRPR